jgi:hypothetical protein
VVFLAVDALAVEDLAVEDLAVDDLAAEEAFDVPVLFLVVELFAPLDDVVERVRVVFLGSSPMTGRLEASSPALSRAPSRKPPAASRAFEPASTTVSRASAANVPILSAAFPTASPTPFDLADDLRVVDF